MFFLSAFFFYWLLYKEKGEYKHFVLLVLFAFSAINTRYASIAVVIVPGVAALFRFIRSFNLICLLFSLLAIATVFLPDIVFEIQGSHKMTGQILVPDWSVENFFRREFFTSDGHFSYSFPNICFVFSNLFNPGYIFTGVLFIFLLKLHVITRQFLFPIVSILFVYALFLAGLTTQNSRFLLVTFPCVLILYSESFFRCWDFIQGTGNSVLKRYMIGKTPNMLLSFLFVTVFLIQTVLFYRAFIPFYKDCRTIQEIALRIKAYPAKTIYTFNIDMGLKAYDVRNEIINLWSCRINNFKSGSLILFNYVNSYHQWIDLNPVYNWERVNKEHDVELIEKLPGGWNLYEIKN